MSVLIYKQRFEKLYKPKTPMLNSLHIEYIATRPRAVKTESDNALFGNTTGDFQSGFVDLKKQMELLREVSQEKKNVYRSIISFSRDIAEQKGLTSLKQWQTYIKRNINTIAEMNNIKPSNLCWLAAIHDEKHHPHCHIVFWDKSQEIGKNYVSPEIPKKIRIKLIKDTFADEFAIIHAEKESSNKQLREATSSVADKVTNKKNKIPADIIRMYAYVNSIRPKTGRQAYAYMPPDVKKELDNFAKMLIQFSPELAEQVKRYTDSRINESSMFTSRNGFEGETEEQKERRLARNKKQDENIDKAINRIIGNIVLDNMKNADLHFTLKSQENEHIKHECNEIILGLTLQFGRLAGNNTSNSENNKLTGELSKQAKKEKAKDLKDKGMEI